MLLCKHAATWLLFDQQLVSISNLLEGGGGRGDVTERLTTGKRSNFQ